MEVDGEEASAPLQGEGELREMLGICFEREKQLYSTQPPQQQLTLATTTTSTTQQLQRWNARGGGIPQGKRERKIIVEWLAEFVEPRSGKNEREKESGNKNEKESKNETGKEEEEEEGILLSLSRRTMYAAINIVDEVEGYYHSWRSLCLAAMAALLIAAKVEEKEEDVPTPVELAMISGHQVSPLLIRR